jgi:hypothetical protein
MITIMISNIELGKGLPVKIIEEEKWQNLGEDKE